MIQQRNRNPPKNLDKGYTNSENSKNRSDPQLGLSRNRNSNTAKPSIPKTINVRFAADSSTCDKQQNTKNPMGGILPTSKHRSLASTTTTPKSKNASWEIDHSQIEDEQQPSLRRSSHVHNMGTETSNLHTATAASIGKDILRNSFGTSSNDDVSEVTFGR